MSTSGIGYYGYYIRYKSSGYPLDPPPLKSQTINLINAQNIQATRIQK